MLIVWYSCSSGILWTVCISRKTSTPTDSSCFDSLPASSRACPTTSEHVSLEHASLQTSRRGTETCNSFVVLNFWTRATDKKENLSQQSSSPSRDLRSERQTLEFFSESSTHFLNHAFSGISSNFFTVRSVNRIYIHINFSNNSISSLLHYFISICILSNDCCSCSCLGLWDVRVSIDFPDFISSDNNLCQTGFILRDNSLHWPNNDWKLHVWVVNIFLLSFFGESLVFEWNVQRQVLIQTFLFLPSLICIKGLDRKQLDSCSSSPSNILLSLW